MGISTVREKKVPAKCIEQATIKNSDGRVCIPPMAIKKAMIAAASHIKDLKKTILRTSIFIEGGSIPIQYSQMIPQMDMVRTSGVGRKPDVRFRPRFEDWSARFIILFPETLPVQSVVDLVNRAGSGGVGEWRPEKDGTFGTFVVSRSISDGDEVKEVRKACSYHIPPLVIPDWAMNEEFSPEILAKIGKEKTKK